MRSIVSAMKARLVRRFTSYPSFRAAAHSIATPCFEAWSERQQ